jgi:type I protein arginine methyltransferase
MSRAGYNIRGHGAMIGDRIRTGAYQEALARTVRPGSVVLDVGTGAGIFALYACHYGARRVFAIEPDPAIDVGRELARANGMSDRIEFIQGISTEVELPERADVVVADLRGVLPLSSSHIASIVDVRRRHLAEGGVLIPRRDTVWAAPVNAPEAHSKITDPWSTVGAGLDVSAGVTAALNDWGKSRFEMDQLVGAPQRWAVLDYTTIENPSVSNELEWTVDQATTLHGYAVWFDAELLEGVGFSTGPGSPETIYGTAFLPTQEPVPLAAGDRLTLRFHGRLLRDDYLWVWETRLERPDGSGARFRQSTLRAALITPEQLRKQAHRFRPALGLWGRVDRQILELMDGAMTVDEIATEMMQRFPGSFTRWEEALSRVARLSQDYSE